MRLRILIASALVALCAISTRAQTGRVSAGNSTTATLGSGATFTGTWDDATQAAVVVVTIKADQISAASGVKVQFSSDCSNLDYSSTASFTDTANGATVAVATAAKCVRIVYVNGASGQGSFRLQTIYRDAGYGGAGGAAASAVTIWDTTDTAQVTTTAGGSLQVECTSGCGGSGGTSAADGASYVAGTTSGTPVIGARDDASPGTVAEDKLGIARITTNRGLHVNLRDAAGAELGIAAAPVQVSLANTAANGTAVTVSASTLTTIAGAVKNEDSVSADGEPLIILGAVRQDNYSFTTSADGDHAGLTADLSGALRVTLAPDSSSDPSIKDYATVRDSTAWTAGASYNGVVGGVFDDVAPTLLTEGNSGTLRMSANRNQYTTLRDSAGNERGANVDASNRLSVAVGNTVTVGTHDVTQATGTNLHTVLDSGTLTTVTTLGTVTNDVKVVPGATSLKVINEPGNSLAINDNAGSITVDNNGTFAVQAGTLTNNNAPPGATNVGVLPAVARASAPSYTEGNQVTLSTDLAGALRVSGSAGGGVAQTQVRNALNAWTDVGYYPGNLSLPVQDALVMQLLQTLIQVQQQAGYIKGTFGRRVNSTGDALDVNIRNNLDPCQYANKFNAAISQTASTKLVSGVEGKRIVVCYARVVAAVAEIVSFTEGTGAACATGTAAVSGSTTAANGESYAANGGFSGGGGFAIASTAKPGDDLCLAQSGAQRVAGNITFVYQ